MYLDPAVMAQLSAYAARRNKSLSLVAEAAIASFLSADGPDRLEAALSRRLDRQSRQAERLERDLGGNRSLVSRRIDGAFYAKGWHEKGFVTSIKVDDNKTDSPTHAVDCLKGGVAVEMEWNNKDPFFDRDLNNFRLLFELRAIQVGIIITRSWELQTIFKQLGNGASYGKATTNHEMLWPKIEGGGGGGCPVLTFAIRPVNFVDDGPEALATLTAQIAAEKPAKKAAKRHSLPVSVDEGDGGEEG